MSRAGSFLPSLELVFETVPANHNNLDFETCGGPRKQQSGRTETNSQKEDMHYSLTVTSSKTHDHPAQAIVDEFVNHALSRFGFGLVREVVQVHI